MTILATTYTNPASNAGSAPPEAATPFKFMEGAHFMQLLLAQLRLQNPLEPLQDREMMTQLAQINSLQELQQINAALRETAAANLLTQSAGLIGKTVEYVDDEGQTQRGVVTGVSMQDGQVTLWLGEERLPLAEVVSVHESEEPAAEA